MRGAMRLLATLAAAAGLFFFLSYYEIHGLSTGGFRWSGFAPQGESPQVVGMSAEQPAGGANGANAFVGPAPAHLTVATLHMGGMDAARGAAPNTLPLWAAVVRRFDVLALQGIDPGAALLMPQLMQAAAGQGGRYDYVVSPPLGRGPRRGQLALIYNVDVVELDKPNVYLVDDPDDLLETDPMVGWFRVRGHAESTAFTFSLVNFAINPHDTERELRVLDDVFRAVRNDGRGEDDVLLAGRFQAPPEHYGPLALRPHMTWAPLQQGLDPSGELFDNVMFHQAAAVEYTGRCGVLNVAVEFQTTREQAHGLSPSSPVWCEFSTLEGGPHAHLSTGSRPYSAVRR